MKSADLHLHSLFSDGTYTPVKLVTESKRMGLEAVSLVDHDTVEGIEPALETARTKNIELLPGIELSAEYKGKEVHILGYLIDYKSKRLKGRLAALKKNRIERVYKIIRRLKGIGISLDPERVFSVAGCGTVGRLHVANALVKEGKVSSVFEAFRKYLGDGRPAFCLGFKLSVQEAIKLIKGTGGIPVLAHPYTLGNGDLILKFIGYGIRGLEIYYPQHSQSKINCYLSLAKSRGLLVTGGSDFHGDAKPEVKLGSFKIPYKLVEELKEAKENLR